MAELLGVGAEGADYIELYCDVVEELDLDAVFSSFSYGFQKISENRARDKYGRIYGLSPHGEPLPAEPLVQDLREVERFDMASRFTPRILPT